MTLAINGMNNNFLKTQMVNPATSQIIMEENLQTLGTTKNTQSIEASEIFATPETSQTKAELKGKKESELISAVKKHVNNEPKEIEVTEEQEDEEETQETNSKTLTGKPEKKSETTAKSGEAQKPVQITNVKEEKTTFSGKDESEFTINVEDIKKGIEIIKNGKKAYDWYKNPAKELAKTVAKKTGKELAKKVAEGLTENQVKPSKNNNDKTAQTAPKTPSQPDNTTQPMVKPQQTAPQPTVKPAPTTPKIPFNGIPKEIKEATTELNAPKPFVKDPAGNLKRLGEQAKNKLEQKFNDVKEFVKDPIKGTKKLINKAINKLEQKANEIKEFVKNPVKGTKKVINKLKNKAKRAWKWLFG